LISASANVNNRNVNNNNHVIKHNERCGTCTNMIVGNDYVICKNCALDFHFTCANIYSDDNIDSWICDHCFFKICNNELPFRDQFIDFRCSLSKGFKIGHLNIQSLRNKVDHIRILLDDNNIDMLCVAETWLKSNVSNGEVHIGGYNMIRTDRPDGVNHGGILCYIKEGIVFTEKSDLQPPTCNVEAIWMELKLPFTKPILLGTVYRKPSSHADYLDELDSLFQNNTSLYDDVIIVGDFNLDVSKTNYARKVKKLSTPSNLKQLITDYTRITETTKSILDLAFVSKPDKVSCSGSHALGLSDHNLIYVIRKNKKVHVEPKTIKSRSFKNFNENDFVDTIKKAKWDNVMKCNNVDDACQTFQSIFDNICNSNCPVTEKRVKGSFPDWITSDFIKLSKDRDYYFAKAQKSNNSEDWIKARQLRNKVNKLNKTLKRNYCSNAINDNVHNSKKLWSTIKKLLPKNVSNTTNVKTQDGLTCNDKATANQFNTYFTSIGNSLASNFQHSSNIDNLIEVENNNQFGFDVVTPDFIFDQICQFSNNKSSGFDDTCIKLLKLSAPIICHPLAYICNLSIITSTFPSMWKKAKVTPIYKDGNRDEVSNYRPISVLPILSKILERAVHNQLYDYLVCNNILSPCQSGFRSNHSTNTTLLDVTDYILNNMNDGNVIGAIFLDLKKAFDTVDHDLLLKKMFSYGITGMPLNWFKSYLTGRSQAVKVNSAISDFNDINIGIPQGSILGPLLFIIFVNSLPDSVDCKCVMYADDTTLLVSSPDPMTLQNKLKNNLDKIATWFESNKLTLNIKKTKLMLFGSNYNLSKFKDITLMYKNDNIEIVDKFKYLGVIFDPNLSWSTHVDYVSSNVSKRIGVIGRIKNYLPQKTTNMLAKALVFPHFDYCSSVWSNFTAYHHHELQVLQNRLARMLLHADIRTPIDKMMVDLEWMKLNCRWDKQLLTITFKCLKKIAPSYISSVFTFTHSVHTKGTRSQTYNALVTPSWNNSSGKRTFHYRASVLWNNLPQNIRSEIDSLSLHAFKNAIVK